MIKNNDHKTRAMISSDDDNLNHTALGMVLEKIRDAETGYQEGTAVPCGEFKRHGVQPVAYTIAGWCQIFSVSLGHYYNLQRRGEGPRVMRLGRRVLISAAAIAEFVRRNEALAESQLSRGAER